MDTPEEFSAVAAEDHLGKTVLAGVSSALSVIAQVHRTSPGKLLLHQKEDVLRNDCFMVSFHIVLRDGAVVFYALLRQEVRSIGLLQECVADVFLISENLVDGACMPLRLACPGENAISLKASGDFVHAQTLQVFSVNAPDDFCLFRIDDQVAISILSVTEKTVVVDLHMSLLVTVLQAELHVLREALAFLLSKGRHDCQQHLPLGIHCVDGLLFEVNRDIYVLQLPDEFQAVQRVPGKPANRFSDDHVDVPGMALVDHAVKLVTLA